MVEAGREWAQDLTEALTTMLPALNVFHIGVLLILIYFGAVAIYNVYFHPLAGFPGPILARSSLLWRMYHSMGGRFHRAIDQQHRIYGPVVRVSPDELSFSSASSWKTIYGQQSTPPPTQTPTKSEFYEMYGAAFDSWCIASERDPQKHRRMKKALSGSFSHRALIEQEQIVAGCVERFVAKIGERGLLDNKNINDKKKKGQEEEGLDMTKWYEMVAFDVLGELAFGESFHSIENGKPHFWSELIENHIYFIALADNLRRLFPLVIPLVKRLFLSFRVVRRHVAYTRGKIASRLATKASRKDFLTNLVGKVETGEMEREELTAHASTLVIAGGETVATFLATITFYLLKEQQAYDKLRDEIRSHFRSYEDICAVAAQQLPYLQAVIKEALRIHPPGSQGFPRVSPGVLVDGHWVPAGTELYTSAWSVTHDERNFHDPFKFKPERWLDPRCTDNKEASQPFSLGPRACLGRNVAYMEINLILAKLLWKYDLELVDDKLDWESESRLHVMWSKPELRTRFLLPRHMGHKGHYLV